MDKEEPWLPSDDQEQKVSAPNPQVVQGSNVIELPGPRFSHLQTGNMTNIKGLW